MAEWKVFRHDVIVMDHPNAERLDLVRVGLMQLVCQKGLHKTGDIIIFIPEKSILPLDLQDGFKDYLKGPNKDRVGSIRLRGEFSLGIAIKDREEFKDIPFGEDISTKLNIIKYEPVVPAHFAGKVKPVGDFKAISYHDVESFSINKDNFIVGENVIITEKIHGSQLYALRDKEGNRFVSSKGMIKRGFTLESEEGNFYWRAVRNSNIFELLDKHYPNINVELFAEGVPCQKNFPYGFSEPKCLVFDIRVDGQHIKFEDIPEDIKKLWVPIVYNGPYDPTTLQSLADQKERVSGKQRHIAEGVVLRSNPDRMSNDKNPFRLMLKVLSKHYKQDDEEIN